MSSAPRRPPRPSARLGGASDDGHDRRQPPPRGAAAGAGWPVDIVLTSGSAGIRGTDATRRRPDPRRRDARRRRRIDARPGRRPDPRRGGRHQLGPLQVSTRRVDGPRHRPPPQRSGRPPDAVRRRRGDGDRPATAAGPSASGTCGSSSAAARCSSRRCRGTSAIEATGSMGSRGARPSRATCRVQRPAAGRDRRRQRPAATSGSRATSRPGLQPRDQLRLGRRRGRIGEPGPARGARRSPATCGRAASIAPRAAAAADARGRRRVGRPAIRTTSGDVVAPRAGHGNLRRRVRGDRASPCRRRSRPACRRRWPPVSAEASPSCRPLPRSRSPGSRPRRTRPATDRRGRGHAGLDRRRSRGRRPPRGGPPGGPACPRARRPRHRDRGPQARGPRAGRPALLPGVVLMAADPLDQVLRLVAEGKLTAEEAAPILAALDERAGSGAGPGPAPSDAGARPGPAARADGRATAPRRRSRPSGSRSVSTAAPSSTCGCPSRWAGSRWTASRACPGEQVDRVREALGVGHAWADPRGQRGRRREHRPHRRRMSAVASVRSMPMWRALAVRDFRLLWSSEAVSVFGDQFHFIALSWLVIDLTRSGLALGTILIAIGVPRALMLLPFGVLADRRPPRNLMLVAHLGRGVVVGAIAALVLSETASLPLLARPRRRVRGAGRALPAGAAVVPAAHRRSRAPALGQRAAPGDAAADDDRGPAARGRRSSSRSARAPPSSSTPSRSSSRPRSCS